MAVKKGGEQGTPIRPLSSEDKVGAIGRAWKELVAATVHVAVAEEMFMAP